MRQLACALASRHYLLFLFVYGGGVNSPLHAQSFCGSIARDSSLLLQQALQSGEQLFYDRFGNVYAEQELAISHYPNALRSDCNSGYYTLSFVGNWELNEVATICAVFNYLSTLINPADPDQMPPIEILVKKEAIGPGVAGTGTPFFEAVCGIGDSRILAQLNDPYFEPYPIGFFVGEMTIDTRDWHTLDEDLPIIEPTDSPVDPNYLDLYTVALHEALHILGFASRIQMDGDALDGFYSRWDSFLFSVPENADILLPDPDPAPDEPECCDRHAFNADDFPYMPTPFANGCNLQLAFRDNDGNIVAPVNVGNYFDFDDTDGANLFLNKLSHLDRSCSDELSLPLADYVMHPGVVVGEDRRILTDAEKTILCQLGYHVNYDIGGTTEECVQECEVFTNPDGYTLFLLGEPNATLTIPLSGILNDVAGILNNDVVPEGASISFDFDCGFSQGLTFAFNGSTQQLSVTADANETGLYSFCYTVSSCDGICRAERITLLVRNQPIEIECNDPECNILCFGDFEDFFDDADNSSGDNYFYQFGGVVPSFQFSESGGNSPDIQKINGNNILHLGKGCPDCHWESVYLPLSDPIADGCEVTVTFNASAWHSDGTPTYNPALSFFALSGQPCEAFPFAAINCVSSETSFCGLSAANMTGGCGQAILFDYPAMPQYSFTWTNNTGQDMTNILLTIAHAGDFNLSVQSYIDNINVFLKCQDQIHVQAADQIICSDTHVTIPYEICYLPEDGTSPPNESITVTIDANIEDLPGISVNSGGVFEGNGQATVIFNPAEQPCPTIDLSLYVADAFVNNTQVTIALEAWNTAGLCTFGASSGMEVVLTIEDCEEPDPELTCLEAFIFTVKPTDLNVVPLIEHGVSRPSYMVAANATWTQGIGNNPFNAISTLAFNTDLVVPAGVTLTIDNMELRFAPSRRILVQPGGWLKINNGMLDGVCETMWQGIQVQGLGINTAPTPTNPVGRLTLTDGEVRNALFGVAVMNLAQLNTNAIAAFDWIPDNPYTNISSLVMPILWQTPARNTAGGQISVTGTDFIDCFQGINLSWSRHLNYSITNAEFLQQAANLQFPFDNPAGRAEAGISVLWANKVLVSGCHFDGPKYGVRANDALTLAVSSCHLENNLTGVSARQILSSMEQSNALKGNHFDNCQLAVQTDGMDFNAIGGNFVNANGNSQNIYATSAGFYLRGSNTKATNNQIHRTDFGIILNQSDLEGTAIYGNLVNNSKQAVVVEGDNGSAEFKCNHLLDYTIAGLDLRPFAPSNGILPQQGDCLIDEPAANTFIPGLASGSFDIRLSPSLPSGEAVQDLLYHDVNASLLTIDDFSPVGNYLHTDCNPMDLNEYCSSEGLTSLDDVDEYIGIGQMQDRRLAKKVLQLLADSQYNQAVSLLHQYNNSLLAKRRLVPHKIAKDSTAIARNLLAQIIADSEENTRFKQLHSLLADLKESGRDLFGLTNNEEQLLRDIAASRTKTSYKAQGLLYARRGTEYGVVMPTLANGGENWYTAFKADEQTWEISPNPAANTINLKHHLQDGETGKLTLYDLTGRPLAVYEFVGENTQHIDTSPYPPGLYVYTVKVGERPLEQGKLAIIR